MALYPNLIFVYILKRRVILTCNCFAGCYVAQRDNVVVKPAECVESFLLFFRVQACREPPRSSAESSDTIFHIPCQE
jgi:hypothetical protein